MARWFYNRPSECCDTAEIKVANKLRRLSKRWTIRWGFYYEDNNMVRREGDFLIFDPQHGLLVLEVKGTRFRQFAPTGRWEGDPDKDPDHPLFQLDQEHAGVLKDLEATEPGWRPVKKAICLPNEFIPEGQRTFQGLPREVFVDAQDLDHIDSVFGRYFDGEKPSHIQKHRDVFLRTYGKGLSREDLKHFIDHNEIIFRKQLTRQYQLLDILKGNRQLFIEGGAGTGKTWNAVEQAVRLAESGTGQHVLLLCYNIALSRFLRDLVSRRPLAQGQISVFQWEELARHVLDSCHIGYQPPAEDTSVEAKQHFYEREVPEFLLECVREEEFSASLPRFDALVVDEAQDHDTAFHEDFKDTGPHTECGWWSIYLALLKEEAASPIALFYDVAQRPPFRGRGGFDAELISKQLSQPAFARLPHALRYTQPLFDFLQTLSAPGSERLIEQLSEPEDLPEGPEVVVIDLDSPDTASVCESVASVVKTWLHDGYCEIGDILILHARTHLENSVLGGCEEIAGFPVVEYGKAIQPGDKVIRHLSINRAKGLDATAVILVGMKPFQNLTHIDQQYTYFMGASRAKQLLAVVHQKA
jgi:hypothetical protein